MKLYAFLFLVLALAPLASAEDIFREPSTTTSSTAYLYNFPYWVATNQSTALYATAPFASTSYVTLVFNGSAANMTYLSTARLYRAYVLSVAEEDVPFSITYYNASGAVLGYLNDTLRFRTPFELEFAFFKNNNATGASLEPYDDEFQYAVLKYAPAGSYSYTLNSGSSLDWLNRIGRIFPYYKDIGEDDGVRVTDEVYLSGRLVDGVATITAFENGTYELFTMNTKVYGGLTALYTFGRPISNDAIPFKFTDAGRMSISTEGDTSYSVFVDAWDVYKKQVVGGLLKVVGVLLVWGLFVIGLSLLLTGWLPLDLRQKAFAGVLSVITLVTSPVVVMGVRLVW